MVPSGFPPIRFVFVLTLVVLASFLVIYSQSDHSASAKGNFAIAYGVKLCNSLTGHVEDPSLNGNGACTDNLSTSANPDLTTTVDVPTGDLNFAALATFTPSAFCIAGDTSSTPQPAGCPSIGITDGEKIGGLKSAVKLGLAGGTCDTPLPVEFVFYEATTDSTNLVNPRPEGQSIRNFPLATPEGTTGGTEGDPDFGESGDTFVTKYPDYNKKLFDPDFNAGGTDGGKSTVEPHALYAGMTKVSTEWVYLGFAIFRPGQLVGDDDGNGVIDGGETAAFVATHPFSRFTADKGWVAITILTPPIPGSFQGTTSTISDFCSDLGSTTMLLGKSSPGNQVRIASPSVANTNLFLTYAISLRDTDKDKLENSLDTCPLAAVINDGLGAPASWDPRAADLTLDADGDGIPGADNTPGNPSDNGALVAGSGCDPTPEADTAGSPSSLAKDHDGDSFINAQDLCTLVANGVDGSPAVGGPGHVDSETTVDYDVAAPDGGPKTDVIGDQCDSNDTVADGHFHVNTAIFAKCIGKDGTDVLDGDNDGWCAKGASPPGSLTLFEKVSYDGFTVAHGVLPSGLTAKDPGSPGCNYSISGGVWTFTLGTQTKDVDCDNWSDWAEGLLGTQGADNCRDVGQDAWPSDIDKDEDTDIIDVLQMKPNFNGVADGSGPNPYSVRRDLDVDSDVDIIDVLQMKPVFNAKCT